MAVIFSQFAEVRFPEQVATGAVGGPSFSTDVVAAGSGHEFRNSNHADARRKWNVAHAIKDNAEFAELLAFFINRLGRAIGFRFKDWSDYQATADFIGNGDGTNGVFQLQKTYAGSPTSQVRTIFKPRDDIDSEGFDHQAKMFWDAVEQSRNEWILDITTGLVQFGAAPALGVAVSWTGEFDVPARFDSDVMQARFDEFNIMTWDNIPIFELLPEPV